jgi:hypothetical protein
MASLLADSIKRITIRTAYGPDIVIDKPFAPSPPSPLLKVLKPEILLDTDFGPLQMAPFGRPGPTKWPFVVGTFIALAGFTAAVGVSKLLDRRRLPAGS